MSATSLYDLAEELLEFCVIALDDLPAGAPARRYVSFGLPALDCEQLTVHCFQVGEADSYGGGAQADRFRRAVQIPRLNLAFLEITVTRACYPVQGTRAAPSVAALTAASQALHADGWQLWNAVPAGIRDGALFSRCGFVGWEPMRPLGPEGAQAGWTMPLQVNLPGFDPPEPGS